MAKESHGSSRAKSVLGGHGKSKSKGGKKPHSMHIKRAHSGGFVVTHHHAPADDGSMSDPDEDHVVPDLDSLHDHIDQNMGDQGPAPITPPPAAPAPAPAPAAGGAAPAPAGM